MASLPPPAPRGLRGGDQIRRAASSWNAPEIRQLSHANDGG